MKTCQISGTGLTLQLGQDGVLQAVFAPNEKQRTLEQPELREAIASFGGLFVLEDGIVETMRRCAVAPLSFSVAVAEQRDAKFAVSVSEDYMTATLTIVPGFGGHRVTEEDVHKELAELGVVHGIDENAIKEAVAAGLAGKTVVAAGNPPQQGQDTQFISLIPEVAKGLQLSDTDKADYRNLGSVVSVSLGDPLLRRTKATPGIPGKNLLGVELPATDGVDIPFAENLTGIACDLTDRELLVAAISGAPVLAQHGVIVDPVFKLKRVDLSTGNLHFKGSLEIAGDVTEGMEVSATEDIVVGGIVEAAKISAGGDIVVKGGVIGHGDLTPNKTPDRKDAAQVQAGGSVTVQFAENAVISAGGDIVIKELAMQSELTSGSAIMVGEEGGRRGHIIGGVCRAVSLVKARVIGSRVGVPTLVEVGFDPTLNRRLEIVKESMADKARLMDELSKTLNYVRENPDSMEKGLVRLKERVFAKYQGEMAELQNEKKRLLKRMEVNALAKVVVEREAFLATQIRIGERSLLIEEDLDNVTFTLTEEGISH